MSYKVIRYFTDLQDNDYAYNVGDTFPREGMTVKQSRLVELAGNSNKQGRPLIEEVVEDDFAQFMNPPVEPETPVEESKAKLTELTKRDIYAMPVAKLRELAAQNGVENVDTMSGNALKKILLDKLFK